LLEAAGCQPNQGKKSMSIRIIGAISDQNNNRREIEFWPRPNNQVLMSVHSPDSPNGYDVVFSIADAMQALGMILNGQGAGDGPPIDVRQPPVVEDWPRILGRPDLG
jgi:hypothetical protein